MSPGLPSDPLSWLRSPQQSSCSRNPSQLPVQLPSCTERWCKPLSHQWPYFSRVCGKGACVSCTMERRLHHLPQEGSCIIAWSTSGASASLSRERSCLVFLCLATNDASSLFQDDTPTDATLQISSPLFYCIQSRQFCLIIITLMMYKILFTRIHLDCVRCFCGPPG